MVSCGQISIDGTKLEANSSRNKITFRKSLEKRRDKYDEKLEEILGEAAKIDEEEDLLYRESDGYSDEHNHSIEEIKKALQKIKGQKEKLERKKDKIKDKIEVIDNKIERMGNRNSFGNTDQDAR